MRNTKLKKQCERNGDKKVTIANQSNVMKELKTGLVLFLGLKIQGLFKDIPGHKSNFSSTPSSNKCH